MDREAGGHWGRKGSEATERLNSTGHALKGTSQVLLVAVDHPAGGGVTGDLGSLPGSGESPGGPGDARQYSCLENPMDREAAAYSHRVVKSRTRLSDSAQHSTSTSQH